MLKVRFQITHRERIPEWFMAIAVLGRGITSLVDSFLPLQRHEMDSAFFATLTAIMPQRDWGVYAALVGLTRLTFLAVNGSRPKGSTVLRSCGAGLSAFYWFGLVLGAAALPYASGALYTYGVLMAFDLLALWYAAQEIAPAWQGARRGGH